MATTKDDLQAVIAEIESAVVSILLFCFYIKVS